MQTNDLCFFIQSVSDWNLPQIKFRILQKLVSFLCSFQGACGLCPLPFAAAVPSPPDRLQQPPVGVRRFSHLGLRFLIFMRTLKTIQTRDSVRRFGFAFACLSYLIGLTAFLSIRLPFSVDPCCLVASLAFNSTLHTPNSTLSAARLRAADGFP